ncbi:MAG: AgmX/PglI C-terminal domain-containing protein [Myxococcales bacterium]|nr:AgmX/PglI C-terminal domain-containing protein [Myxococcales bacterium]
MTNPSSRPPAGVPTSGSNAKYAIVAAVLSLAIVAIVVWRRSSDRESQPAPPPAPSVALAPPPPSNPKVEEIPPPPPVEEKPEAGASGPRVVYVQSAPCEAKCSGSATPELEQALQVRGMQARRCYNEALARDPTLHGHLVFDVRISQAGNVCAVNVTSNDMGSPKVANCAAHILGSNAYPAPRGGCIDSQVPLSFVTPGGQ